MKERSSFIAVCGAPNSGKSTLINLLVGSKITIVSPRPQTTRITIRGIAVYDDAQLVYIDTPGIFRPKGKRQKEMVKSAWGGVDEAEQILLLIDAKKGLDAKTRDVVEALQTKGKKVICAINKVDLVDKGRLLPMVEELHDSEIFSEIFMISAEKNLEIEKLKNYLISKAVEQPWPYDKEQISDMNDRLFAAEITREKAFLMLRDELPYGVDVETETYKEDDKRIEIHQNVLTGQENHKKIIIGKKAEMVKKIGTMARKEMEKIFGLKVNLFLHVKVDKKLRG